VKIIESGHWQGIRGVSQGWLDTMLQVPNDLMGNGCNGSGQTGIAGLHDDLPFKRASFGIYGPKSPIIYRRENY
jgi:hypothetical protein